MTIDNIKSRLRTIKYDLDGDDEAQHEFEDMLHKDFIEYVMHNRHDPDLAEKAKLVLSTEDIEFHRWYA